MNKINNSLQIYKNNRTRTGNILLASRFPHFPPVRATGAFQTAIRLPEALKIREMG